jgi:hypothetical protein
VICSICGDMLLSEVVQSESRMLAHRLLRHQPSAIQWAGAFGISVVIVWLIGEFGKRLR